MMQRQINRRDVCKMLAGGPAALALAVSRATAAAGEKLNVLFIAVDDLRPQLGCYGDSLVKSPNLDQLAARGLVFNRCYCQQALCSPSRTSLLTGLRPDTTKIVTIGPHFRDSMPDVVTLPQHFKNHGYVTRAIGKVYHDGLDDKASWSALHENAKVPGYSPKGQTRLKERLAEAKRAGIDISDRRKAPYGPAYEAPDCLDNELRDGANADRAREILREIKDRPFFFGVGFSKPHIPYVAPKKYWDLYDPQQITFADNQFPPKGAPAWAIQGLGELRRYDGPPQNDPLPEEWKRRLIHGYMACISYIDAQIGRLLGELDRLGLRDKTVVIAWGDNGYQLGEHGMWSSKHTNYETSTLCPMIIRVPGQKTAGQKSDALVEFVDIYPSLVEICGLPMPESLEGTSFKPLIEKPGLAWKKAAFSQYPRGGYDGHTIRTDRWRLVEWRKTKGSQPLVYELYDHQNDPQENVNLANDPKHADTIKELAAMLKTGWKTALPSGK